jgi:uncharacterized membrane protein
MQPVTWRRVFIATAAVWAISIVAAPLVASRSSGHPLADAGALAIYFVGRAICHQRPERSFHLWGAQLPVCARCTGLYAGAAFAPLMPIGRRLVGRTRAGMALALAAAPTLATLVYEWTTGDAPSNVIRMAAGLWLGAGVARILADALH